VEVSCEQELSNFGVFVDYYKNSKKLYSRFPTSLATRSKAWVCSRSLSGTAGSKSAGVTDILSLVGVVCCQAEVHASG
jgi:hypothetical protein